MSGVNLDEILGDLGHFGKFQKTNYILICLVIAFSVFPMSYIFTTRDLKYRCFIEECDGDEYDAAEYKTTWLRNAIPYTGKSPLQCLRYAGIGINSTGMHECNEEFFNRSAVVACTRFVYESDDLTIGRDFDVTCSENLWKLTIIGTINCIGELVCLPLSGYFSDKYGRRTTMIVSVLLTTLAGSTRSFAPSYVPYVVLEFLDTALGSGCYSAAFILAMELVVPEHRVTGNTILACAFALGEALLGLAAWISPSWRIMLRILYTPGILFISYFWLTHESVRWLLSKGRNQDAKQVLKEVAEMNGTAVSDDVIRKLNISRDDEVVEESFLHVFKAPRLFLRLVNCSFSWICCTFVYYGLTLHSVSISGNIYVNYIAVAAVEMPAYFVSYHTLDRIGRRLTLAPSFILSGLACISFIFVPDENARLKLALFLVGKFFVTIAYTVLYMYTTELFPTRLRHSLLATCSMFGRFGSMVAPQIPLLVTISESLPLALFGIMACSTGALSFLFPETHNVKLPDTIEEAVSMGEKQ